MSRKTDQPEETMSRKTDDRELALARVYAESLFALAEERGAADEVAGELTDLVAVMERDPDLGAFFASPLVDRAGRRKVLEASLRGAASDLVVDTLQVMNSKGRLAFVPALAAAYGDVLDERRGRVDVAVTTAVELSEPLWRRLRETLGRATKREVRIVVTVDPGILGGVIVSVGDRKIDYSLAADLRRLDHQLRERATHEIHGAT
ncbi:MAG: ATP synthase F1 subunit delta [Acidobacteriota bacterium]|nr:ATP synthase F1 subunit delta [Acidobacteriota bacterium]MDH3525089.1 ATP synthase F1 subunit delta [Acidobacteriota bacterium]